MCPHVHRPSHAAEVTETTPIQESSWSPNDKSEIVVSVTRSGHCASYGTGNVEVDSSNEQCSFAAATKEDLESDEERVSDEEFTATKENFEERASDEHVATTKDNLESDEERVSDEEFAATKENFEERASDEEFAPTKEYLESDEERASDEEFESNEYEEEVYEEELHSFEEDTEPMSEVIIGIHFAAQSEVSPLGGCKVYEEFKLIESTPVALFRGDSVIVSDDDDETKSSKTSLKSSSSKVVASAVSLLSNPSGTRQGRHDDVIPQEGPEIVSPTPTAIKKKVKPFKEPHFDLKDEQELPSFISRFTAQCGPSIQATLASDAILGVIESDPGKYYEETTLRFLLYF